MPAPRDRPIHVLEQDYPAAPLPPLNAACSVQAKGIVDVRWTSPSELQANSRFNVLGVNVYRSFDSEYGPFFRVNTVPVGCNFWRDSTQVVLAMQEDVSKQFVLRGPETDGAGRYAFRTRFRPIVIHPSPGSANCTNLNVQVTVNGAAAFVEAINAPRGEVDLRMIPSFDVTSQKLIPAVLPIGPDDVVLASYKYVSQEVRTNLGQRIFYRLATVAYDAETGALMETPLERSAITNSQEVEKLDFIWREAIRRNKWILNQGGERVKAFIRRVVGPRCGCNSSLHGQPSSDCIECYGTGILGGYDGPFDILIAPDDGDKSIAQSNRGRSLNHGYETWTGPSPLFSQRDFIVKLNGDRYGIGPVRMPSNRGMQLQQFFSIGHLDESDIRYKVPIPDTFFMRAPQTKYLVPGKGDSTPMMTDAAQIPDERELRGGTVTWENIEY